MVAHYSAGATAERGAVATYLVAAGRPSHRRRARPECSIHPHHRPPPHGGRPGADPGERDPQVAAVDGRSRKWGKSVHSRATSAGGRRSGREPQRYGSVDFQRRERFPGRRPAGSPSERTRRLPPSSVEVGVEQGSHPCKHWPDSTFCGRLPPPLRTHWVTHCGPSSAPFGLPPPPQPARRASRACRTALQPRFSRMMTRAAAAALRQTRSTFGPLRSRGVASGPNAIRRRSRRESTG